MAGYHCDRNGSYHKGRPKHTYVGPSFKSDTINDSSSHTKKVQDKDHRSVGRWLHDVRSTSHRSWHTNDALLGLDCLLLQDLMARRMDLNTGIMQYVF